MPAPFTSSLCGFRTLAGNPNTSDGSDGQSVRLGRRLFDEMGVDRSVVREEPQGANFEISIVEYLKAVRKDLRIERSRPASDFVQYAHLKAYQDFRKAFKGSVTTFDDLQKLAARLPAGLERQRLTSLLCRGTAAAQKDSDLAAKLAREMPEESLLKLDISVGIPMLDGGEELAIAVSAKWSLRTDRAQDCISQGNKLVAQRRGKMPHFAVITMEPRPHMLSKIADGSGAVDWVYHLDLPALIATISGERDEQRRPSQWSPGRTFDRLIWQNRIRDFDELVRQVVRLPSADL